MSEFKYSKDGTDAFIQIEQAYQLRRIADSLELIENHLKSLSLNK